MVAPAKLGLWESQRESLHRHHHRGEGASRDVLRRPQLRPRGRELAPAPQVRTSTPGAPPPRPGPALRGGRRTRDGHGWARQDNGARGGPARCARGPGPGRGAPRGASVSPPAGTPPRPPPRRETPTASAREGGRASLGPGPQHAAAAGRRGSNSGWKRTASQPPSLSLRTGVPLRSWASTRTARRRSTSPSIGPSGPGPATSWCSSLQGCRREGCCRRRGCPGAWPGAG